jgi:hypothetical protein
MQRRETTKGPCLRAFCRSPLPDSNRRPPPYHGAVCPPLPNTRSSLRSAARGLADLSRRLKRANEGLAKIRGVKANEAGTSAASPEGLKREQAALQRAASHVVDFANYEFTRRTFQSLFPRLALLGFLAALSVGTYAVAVNSAPAKAPAVDKPIEVALTLRPQARKWSNVLGPNCDLQDVRAVAVGGPLNGPEVVFVRTDTCRAARFRVGRRQGVAVPVTTTRTETTP